MLTIKCPLRVGSCPRSFPDSPVFSCIFGVSITKDNETPTLTCEACASVDLCAKLRSPQGQLSVKPRSNRGQIGAKGPVSLWTCEAQSKPSSIRIEATSRAKAKHQKRHQIEVSNRGPASQIKVESRPNRSQAQMQISGNWGSQGHFGVLRLPCFPLAFKVFPRLC